MPCSRCLCWRQEFFAQRYEGNQYQQVSPVGPPVPPMEKRAKQTNALISCYVDSCADGSILRCSPLRIRRSPPSASEAKRRTWNASTLTSCFPSESSLYRKAPVNMGAGGPPAADSLYSSSPVLGSSSPVLGFLRISTSSLNAEKMPEENLA